MEYNNYAIVFNWEIINDYPDIGKWEMLFEEDEKEVIGEGMSEFLETLSQLSLQEVNIMYVNNLNLFEVIGANYMSYNYGFMAGVKDGTINFFQLRPFEFIEFRNWNLYWEDCENCKEFLKRLNACRENFKGKNKNKLSIKSHYRFTLSKDMWTDLTERFYLKSSWSKPFREALLPKDEIELDLYLRVNKASFMFLNPEYANQTLNNIYMDDISSSHSGFMYRKKYPYEAAQQIEDIEDFYKIIEDDFHAWIAEIEFVDLYEKFDLRIDLRQFGYLNEDDNWVLILTNAHWKTFKRLFGAKDIIPHHFRYFKQKELVKNYAIMFSELYEEKETFKKAFKEGRQPAWICNLFKFRTELPFGQSIKSPTYYQTVYYDEEKNEFFKMKTEPESFEDIVKRIDKNVMPFQVGIWTAAYSWAEEVNMILDLGVDNVVYADTDSVAYINKDGIEIIKNHNKEIDKEVYRISSKRNMTISPKLGRWQHKGCFNKFKAINIKWYMYEENGEIEVKAAGAIIDKLKEQLLKEEDPFNAFCRDVYGKDIFKNISISKETGTVHVSYNNFMGELIERRLNQMTNGYFI